LKSIDYNVAMTFIFNSNSNNNNSYYYFLNFFITIVIIITTLSQADIRIEWSYVAFWPRVDRRAHLFLDFDTYWIETTKQKQSKRSTID